MNLSLRRARARHRCASAIAGPRHAPENTMLSFMMGADMGVTAVETDVHLSKDGEVVLIHDHTVDRTTDGHGFVKDMTLAEDEEAGCRKLV